MIGVALKLLRDELSEYIFSNRRSGDNITQDDIVLHNIALLESDTSGDLNNRIIITLVNTEEESTLKNNAHVLKGLNGIQYVEPAVFLNLYILISATLGEDLQDAYEFALNRLSLVIQFFQRKRSFTIKNSPFNSISNDDSIVSEIKQDLRLNVELYTLTFEQINHLWGSLGGKQVPFAMYKVRLVKIQEIVTEEAPVIEELQNDYVSTYSSPS